jgi:hypothetical protein
MGFTVVSSEQSDIGWDDVIGRVVGIAQHANNTV